MRVRLQSTTAVTVPATDDWQLQYERNASGTWINIVPEFMKSVELTPGGATNQAVGVSGRLEHAQSFIGDGRKLAAMDWQLVRLGTPPAGNAIAKLWAHTGTYGTTGTPTGTALATSPGIVATTIQTFFDYVRFTFDGTYTLVNGTPYFASIIAPYTDASNNICYSTGNVVSGNESDRTGASTWVADAGASKIAIYTSALLSVVGPYDSPNLTGASASTNRLTGGSGSFVAGEVSEDGQVNDKGWRATTTPSSSTPSR